MSRLPMLKNDNIIDWLMEGDPSRWNTLRALRVLKWWNREAIHGFI